MLTARNLTLADLGNINNCIQRHTTMYSVPMEHGLILDRFRNYINDHKAVGVFEGDECVGVSTQYFWSKMPIWSASNMFLLTNTDSLFLTKNTIIIMGMLLEQMIANGENDDRYEFYYVTRDSTKLSKKIKSYNTIMETNTPVAKRYDYIDIHVLTNANDIKWDYVREIVGEHGLKALSPPYNKTLIIRKGILKSEYRKIV